ncbi:MAG: hypothetical protein GY910_16735 [bacterium]|nr:hypothetical protein [Deltaproteobacteria bacterium]MCP4906623.1 hypothetical protein [bacterium]
MSLAIEVVLLEVARLADEGRKLRMSGLSRGAGLRVPHRVVDLGSSDRSKIEAQILDLVGAGMTVTRLLDMIQEPDRLIGRNLLALIERGVVQLENGSAEG